MAVYSDRGFGASSHSINGLNRPRCRSAPVKQKSRQELAFNLRLSAYFGAQIWNFICFIRLSAGIWPVDGYDFRPAGIVKRSHYRNCQILYFHFLVESLRAGRRFES
jgi:hypothetical protein